jgi:hypothetical protein
VVAGNAWSACSGDADARNAGIDDVTVDVDVDVDVTVVEGDAVVAAAAMVFAVVATDDDGGVI